MGVSQVLFDIPKEIQDGLDAGTLIQWGGIIRDTAGKIVKHLKALPVTKDSSSAVKVVSKADQLTNSHGKLIDSLKGKKGIVIGVAVVTITVGGVIYSIVKKKRKKKEYVDVPKYIVDFNNHLMTYVQEIRDSNVKEKTIERVLSSLEVIKEKQEKGLLDGDFSYNNAEALLNMIKEYTEKLVEANNQSMPDTVELKNDKIVDLQTYLKIQKNVFRNNRSA